VVSLSWYLRLPGEQIAVIIDDFKPCSGWQGQIDEVNDISVQVPQTGWIASLRSPSKEALASADALLHEVMTSNASLEEVSDEMPIDTLSNSAPSQTCLRH
jgi:hypothetical protein